MLTGGALKRYFATCQNLQSHKEIFHSLQAYFENDEHRCSMLRQWQDCSLKEFSKKNPDKTLTETLRLMIAHLEELQYCLSEEYQGQRSMFNRLIDACMCYGLTVILA